MRAEINTEVKKIEAAYNSDGSLIDLYVTWRGETIAVCLTEGNGPTRELQRADEIMQALCAARK